MVGVLVVLWIGGGELRLAKQLQLEKGPLWVRNEFLPQGEKFKYLVVLFMRGEGTLVDRFLQRLQ